MSLSEEGIEGAVGNGRRPVVYCLIPPDLAGSLHDVLRRHFRDDPRVEVVVDRRHNERRAGAERRAKPWPVPKGQAATEVDSERRAIRNRAGRRVGDRRASLVPIDTPKALPRRARAHAERIVFAERLEPSTERLEDLDTARLVTRFQAGDREAFVDIYSRYFDRIYGYLRVILKRQHEAEDAAQEVFTHVFAALERYERRAQPFRAWLFTAARNHAITNLRKAGRLELTEPDELDRRRDEAREAELPALNWITDNDLLLFIERLPLAQRQVLALRFLYGLDTAEIAATLDRNIDDIRGLQHRGLKFLRNRLSAVAAERPARGQARMRTRHKQAPVLRYRRFALRAP
jgi:RNA polymerase sigma-70 factor (ECF subfamily)